MKESERGSYHVAIIAKGVVGEISKIVEEVHELEDASLQGNKVMCLCELSDIYGAIECYLQKHTPSITMGDLAVMSNATKEAFKNGRRA